ncbi:MAG: hypothetical protein LBT35_01015 [Tannerella sp.]|nr:hypothetical protein [Tannerella sp.]
MTNRSNYLSMANAVLSLYDSNPAVWSGIVTAVDACDVGVASPADYRIDAKAAGHLRQRIEPTAQLYAQPYAATDLRDTATPHRVESSPFTDNYSLLVVH